MALENLKSTLNKGVGNNYETPSLKSVSTPTLNKEKLASEKVSNVNPTKSIIGKNNLSSNINTVKSMSGMNNLSSNIKSVKSVAGKNNLSSNIKINK